MSALLCHGPGLSWSTRSLPEIAPITSAAPAAGTARRHRGLVRQRGAATRVLCGAAAILSTSARTSPIACQRFLGFFSRHRSIKFVQSWIDLRRQRGQIGFANDDRRQNIRCGITLKRLAPGQHFVEHGAKREDIAPLIGRKALRLFGRHVGRRPENHAGIRAHHAQRRRVRERIRVVPAQPHRMPSPIRSRAPSLYVGCNLHVRWFQIAMDDAASRAPLRALRQSAARWPCAALHRNRDRGGIRSASVSPSNSLRTIAPVPSDCFQPVDAPRCWG